MSVKYNVTSKKIGFGKNKTDKFVAAIMRGDTVSAEDLIKQVQKTTLIPVSMVEAVLNNMTDAIETFIRNGNGVRIGKLGILKPSLNCQSGDKTEDVKIKRSRIIFLPSTQLKDIAEDISIKKVGENTDDESDGDADTSNTGTGSSGTGGGDMAGA